MTRHTEKHPRFYSLIILGCTLLIIVLVSAATSSTHSAAQFGPSPSPVTTPQEQTKERPNPVRRFFSWVTKAVRRPFRKRVPPISDPPIVRITSSTSLINFCPPWMDSLDNCSASREVELSATAGGPDLDAKLLYIWAVSAGRIRGKGQLCQRCFTRESPCPTIMVSCPDNAKSNQSLTFQADVSGGDPTVKVTYTWTVTVGKISGGQGTSMITIDVSDVTRESITATVSIGGLDAACPNTASCTTRTAGSSRTVSYLCDAR